MHNVNLREDRLLVTGYIVTLSCVILYTSLDH